MDFVSEAGALATVSSIKSQRRKSRVRALPAVQELISTPMAAPTVQDVIALASSAEAASPAADAPTIDTVQSWLGFYRCMLSTAQRMARTCDLGARENFTRGFWILSQSATSRVAMARHLEIPEATMTRWTSGTTAPAPAVRRAFLLAALEFVELECVRGARWSGAASVATAAPSGRLATPRTKTATLRGRQLVNPAAGLRDRFHTPYNTML